MSTKIQTRLGLHSALPALAIVMATSVFALSPNSSRAAEPMKHETGATMPMNDAKMHGMTDADHAKMHEQMATEHAQMHDSMDMKGDMPGMAHTGDVDHDFAANMRRHHEMGVKMAQAQIKAGRDPEMTRVAKEIVSAQEAEIAVLDRWLDAHKVMAPKAE